MAVRVGIAGLGGMAERMHCPTVSQMKEFELVAVCDMSEKRVVKISEKYGIDRIYYDYEQFLKDDSVDLVIVSVPNNLHATFSIKAMQAGKHVIVEKPMALNLSDADDMLSVRDRNRVMLSVFHNRRWDSDYCLIKELLNNGCVGELFLVESRIADFGTYEGYAVKEFRPRWRLEKTYGGGILYDLGPHLVDQVLQLIPSEIETVFGNTQSRLWSKEVEDYFKCIIHFQNGVVAQLEASHISTYPLPRWYIVGSKGTLVKNYFGEGDERIRLRMNEAGGKETIPEQVKSKPAEYARWKAYYMNIYEVLEYKRELAVMPEQAREVVKVLDAVRKSAGIGNTVRF